MEDAVAVLFEISVRENSYCPSGTRSLFQLSRAFAPGYYMAPLSRLDGGDVCSTFSPRGVHALSASRILPTLHTEREEWGTLFLGRACEIKAGASPTSFSYSSADCSPGKVRSVTATCDLSMFRTSYFHR